MAYVPPPYLAPPSTVDPTAVMGRRISAFLIDVVLPTLAAGAIGAIVWFGAAQQHPKADSFNVCSQVRYEATQSGQNAVACFETNDKYWVASGSDTGRAVLVGVLVWLIVPLNVIFLQGLSGASIGKHLLGLRVVRGDGTVAGFGAILVRGLLLVVAIGLGFLCGLGIIAELIVASATKPHRRVGDMAAGTFVVRKTSVGQPILNVTSQPIGFSSPQTQWAPPPTNAGFGQPPASWGVQPQPSASEVGAPAPTAWGSPVPENAGETPGWGAPQPTAATAQPSTSPQPQSFVPATDSSTASTPSGPATDDPTQPRWDPDRNAYIAWEPTRRQWMQHDTTTNEWRPI